MPAAADGKKCPATSGKAATLAKFAQFAVTHPRPEGIREDSWFISMRPAGIYSFLIGEANNNRFLPCGRNDIVICSTYIKTDSRICFRFVLDLFPSFLRPAGRSTFKTQCSFKICHHIQRL